MDIEYKGGNCVVVTTKKAVIVTDPKLSDFGLTDQGKNAAVQLLTEPQFQTAAGDDTLVLNCPGEYEIVDVSVNGIPARGYTDPKTDPQRITMYKIETADISLLVTGHINPELSEEQLETIGLVDVLILPVGGNGFTLDATGAVQVIRAIDPKVVVPVFYAESGVNYPIPAAELDLFAKELGAAREETAKLKLKPGVMGETLVLQEIKRTK